MSVQSIIPSIDSSKKVNKLKQNQINGSVASYGAKPSNNVSFQGNPIVATMDFIEAGGYAASFIIQDGIGFITPRVGKGLMRGGKEKVDENGNAVLDKNGKPQRELNWALARKEFLREIITGPSAFLIPLGLLRVIKSKFGTGNNVKLNYINSFNEPFAQYAKKNLSAIKDGTANRASFYESVLEDAIENSINGNLADKSEHMSKAEISAKAKEFASRQIEIEDILADKSLSKTDRKARLAELDSVEDLFMKLKKNRVGGNVNEMSVQITSSNGLKTGTISELMSAVKDYFGDAVNNARKTLNPNATFEQIEDSIKHFTNRRMGSRVLTNLGIFGVVAAFYTQIPKLYNMGLKGNPALSNQEDSQQQVKSSQPSFGAKNKVSFTGGMASLLEQTGEKVFNGKNAKKFSDIFELNGPVISGTAMTTLLYGFCIPPRLEHAQDKYDFGEIVLRDMTAFTALLFGAKALARLFSDGFTKITGLALNNKDMEKATFMQKVVGYLSPNDTRHHVLSSKQLISKYTHLEDYKGEVNGFVEFIEASGGNIKKAFAQDKAVQESVDEIVKAFNGKSFKDATVAEIKDALKAANKEKNDLIKKFYKLFESENGLLSKAKTCNSSFGFISTLVLVPGLIMWLTNACEKMTANRIKKNKEQADLANRMKLQPTVVSNSPTMAGFLNKAN